MKKKSIFLMFIGLFLMNSILAQTIEITSKSPCEQKIETTAFDNYLFMIFGQRLALDIDVLPKSSFKILNFLPNIGSPEQNLTFSVKIYENSASDLPGNLVSTSTTAIISKTLVGSIGEPGNQLPFYKYDLNLDSPITLQNNGTTTKKYWLELVPSGNAFWHSTNTQVLGKPAAAFNPQSNTWNYTQDATGIDELVYVIKADCLSLSTNNAVKEKLSIYPNPVTDYVEITQFDKVESIEVLDVSGKLIRTIEKPQQKTDFSKLKSGFYILRVNLKDNSSETRKILKK